MDPSSKLADLTLVSKYYPVANYSYPRHEAMTKPGTHAMALSDRLSVGSEGSAPGLVDDRTDSEASGDDDEYHYRALAAEIWDSFWKPGEDEEKEDEPEIHPRKQYPALIPSPQRRRHRSAEDLEQMGRSPAWPLPEIPGRKLRERQPAASYSAFPRPIALPPPGKPAAPSWQCSRQREPREGKKPQQPEEPETPKEPKKQPPRPPRPDEKLLTPCIPQEPCPVTTVFTSSVLSVDTRGSDGPWSAPLPERDSMSSPEPRPRPRKSSLANRLPIAAEMQRPKTSHGSRPPTPPTPPTPPMSPTSSTSSTSAEARRPKSSRSLRPMSPVEVSRPKTSLGSRPTTPFEPPDTPAMFSPTTCLPIPSRRRRLTPDPEPRSFFEHDSDCDDDGEGSRSFFRFHKRSTSDPRRSARSSEEAPRRRRGCTTSGPASPTHSSNPERKRPAADVFGRMLGRRSR